MDRLVFLNKMMLPRFVNVIHSDRVRVVSEKVKRGIRTTDEELSDLHRRQCLFEDLGEWDREGRDGVVGVHESVDGRVEEEEDPDWR